MSNLRRSRPDIQHLQELYRCDFICIALQIFEDDYNNHCWIIPTVFKDLVLGHFQGVPLYCMQVVTSGHDSIWWPKTSFQKFLSSFPLMTFFFYILLKTGVFSQFLVIPILISDPCIFTSPSASQHSALCMLH